MRAPLAPLVAFLAAVPARSLHSTPPPRRRTSRLHATEWQTALDGIDGDAWRDLRRELYGAPDAAPCEHAGALRPTARIAERA